MLDHCADPPEVYEDYYYIQQETDEEIIRLIKECENDIVVYHASLTFTHEVMKTAYEFLDALKKELSLRHEKEQVEEETE